MKKELFLLWLLFTTTTAHALQPVDVQVTSDPTATVNVTVNGKRLSTPFTKVAGEGESFTIVAPAGKGYAIRYGAGETWISRDLPAGTYVCENAVFTDPLVGTVKQCEQSSAQLTIPPPPPPNVPVVPPMMHAGVQGILWDNPIIASFDGMGFQTGIDTYAFWAATPLPPAGTEDDWEKSGAIRQVCKFSHVNNDDAIVYPGQPGKAHDHIYARPGTNASLTNDNIRAVGNKSTCRGGILDLTARWLPAFYDTTNMRGIIPHILLMYYKEECQYSIDCSGYTEFKTKVPDNIHFVPKGLHLIAGDPMATEATGVISYTCLVIATGNGRVGANNLDTIPKCLDDGSESLWASVHVPNCLAVNVDGSPVLDSPDHKSHLAYEEGWPQYVSPTPGKSYRCPVDHPYQITSISFKVIFELSKGMDTSKWNLSCGSVHCLHADWFDGWDHDIMDKTSDECLAKRRDCGSFQVYDGRTAAEFQGN